MLCLSTCRSRPQSGARRVPATDRRRCRTGRRPGDAGCAVPGRVQRAVRVRRARRGTAGLVNPMIPRPGETAGGWWDAVDWKSEAQASAERAGRLQPQVDDLDTLFLHDPPADLAEVMRSNSAAGIEGPAVFHQPWPLQAWPALPTRVPVGRDDRLFPPSPSGASLESDWISTSKSCPAATSSLSANPQSWPTGSRDPLPLIPPWQGSGQPRRGVTPAIVAAKTPSRTLGPRRRRDGAGTTRSGQRRTC